MDEIIAKLEVCMATLNKMAASQDVSDIKYRGRPYVSMVKVDGKPILPPLMTPDKRAEMTGYRAMAMQREREREERKRQQLVARVETIVNSYEDSRQSLVSTESSPQRAAATMPGQAMQAPDMQSVKAKPVPAAQPVNNPSYSPLKYMEMDMDEEEWNVRPATPWRRTKQSKTRTVIAANFDPRGHQPISSTMRVDHSQDIRGTTPNVSAISLASTQAYNLLTSNSPGDAIDPSSSVQPVLKEVLPSSPPGLENLKTMTTDGYMYAASLPADASCNFSADVNVNNLSEPQDNESHEHSADQPPNVSAAHVDSAVISRLSPIPKIDAVKMSGNGVAVSTGSQSTSSSSNSALNQTVIDLSQMSLIQGQTSAEKAGDSPKPDKNIPDSQPQSSLSTESQARVGLLKDDIGSTDIGSLVPNTQEDNHAAGYLSDTESYMSLLGEYSLLPTPGSNRGTPDTIPKKDAKKVPFFTDPTSPGALGAKRGADRTGQVVEGFKSDVPATDASVEPGESLKSMDMSEYCGSSFGTLAQSVTLPISLSVTSESTLHGIGETWDRTSQEVTPTGTEGGLSTASDEMTNAGMVRAAPVGQESNASAEVEKQTRIASDKMEKTGVKVERSGVKVDNEFQSPLRHHTRKSSYTLDFPSPALLDAEARHQAPHVSGRDISFADQGTKVKEAGVGAVNEAEQVTVSDAKQPDELSSDMKDLKIGDVSEAKVLSLQLSCLEQMQQRLQRQHDQQMNELMLQQSQELCLLECEMEGIRRQAAESALGHVEDKDVMETSVAVPSLHDERMKVTKNKKSTTEKSANMESLSKSPIGKDDRSERESSNVASNQRKNPPPSPNSRKRRFEESAAAGGMMKVPPSYIKASSLAGKGHAFPGFHSPISEKLLAKAKLTPQDSLESDRISEGGMVEVPPSYIQSGSYHRPVSRSPTHNRSLSTPTDTGSAHLASPSIPAEEPSMGDSSHLTTWGTPLAEVADTTKLSTWASPAVDKTGGSGHFGGAVTSDPVYVQSLSDSFFLNEGQSPTGGTPERHVEQVHQQRQTASDFRPWTISPGLQMDSRFDKISAGVKGYLTRALMRTPKVKSLIKTIKDTQVFLYQIQAETPVKRGKLSEQDTKLAHRVLAQLRAAQYELDDIFHLFPIHQRMAMLRQIREQERENFFNKKVSPHSAGHKAKLLSTATRKAMERRQLAKEGDDVQSGPKRQKLVPANQRPKSAAETRVLRPLQSHKLPARPATAIPPRISSISITTQGQKVKPSSAQSKPFPTKPVMVSRKTSRSPSRPSSRPASTRPTSTRPTSTRPTSRLSGASSIQARTTSTRQAKSPARAATSSQTKTKSVRRSLYPVAVGTGKKTMQRKQVETRKP